MNRKTIERREVSATDEREIASNIFIVAPGVWRMKDIFVNVYIIQNRESTNWVLLDTGLKTSAPKIKNMIVQVFGTAGIPSSIIMTHGHFDHVGSLVQLADEWNVPVYCHHMEAPYLSGKSAYPPSDPTVGGGIMPALSVMFPTSPVNIQDRLRDLPENGEVPDLPEWKWIYTPGHAPGHISLFRESDGVLVAGDAFVTTRQESAFSIMTQKKVLSGPPKYFTPDWGAAARSLKELSALEPNVVATGHGQSMYGDEARKALHKLSREFWKLGMPNKGRYVREPALFNEDGVTYIPPMRNKVKIAAIAGVTVLALVALAVYKRKQKSIF